VEGHRRVLKQKCGISLIIMLLIVLSMNVYIHNSSSRRVVGVFVFIELLLLSKLHMLPCFEYVYAYV
jgi:hypothetical protein